LGVRSLKKWVAGSWDVSYATGDKGIMENYDNGFLGSIDPRPFLDPAIPEYPGPYSLTALSLVNQIKALYQKLSLYNKK
jgi:hypothetical protein